jgi:hypothetical protein
VDDLSNWAQLKQLEGGVSRAVYSEQFLKWKCVSNVYGYMIFR